MRLPEWLMLVPLLGAGTAIGHMVARDYGTTDYFAVQLHEGSNPDRVAHELGLKNEGPIGAIPHHFTFSCPKNYGASAEQTLDDLKMRRRHKRSLGEPLTATTDGVLWHRKQQLRQRHVKRIPPPLSEQKKSSEPQIPGTEESTPPATPEQQAAALKQAGVAATLGITDPIFNEQWHLFNTKELGHDMNVTGVWLDGITGEGSVSCIVDDGLDFTSNDLKPNYFAGGSWDYNDEGPDPLPRLSDDNHGTRCAGEVAAAKNDVCGVGMAYGSQVSGVRILSKPISDEDEALAIIYKYDENDIYSCSWGPPDDGQTMEAPDLLIRRAMVQGIQRGRKGLGSIYVFAAGNGANADDNCNFDGYTNSIYSITVGAIDRAGKHPYYSESCSANLVVTYSSGSGDAIHTTDRSSSGSDTCYNSHGGTSAAGPLMVGAAALALGIRPDLTWRDMQYLVIKTAVPIQLDDGEWQDTAMGKKYSHRYGYGKLDTWAFIEAAKTHQVVKPQAWFHSPWLAVAHAIPEGDQGLAASFDVTQAMMDQANMAQLEHVQVTMNVNHTRRGDLSVELRSPGGLVSHLATARRLDSYEGGYEDWTFMSVLHWGETGVGTWTVIVKDHLDNDNNGTFIDWRLNLWGEAINGNIQGLHPLPDEHDDDHETATAVVATTSVSIARPPTGTPSTPSDHPDRPTKPKPESTTESSTQGFAASTGLTGPATATASTTQAASSATNTVSDSFLPGLFPTFGVSKTTQVWIYGSATLIVLFCAGLGAYFVMQRRKRRRDESRDDYEFEMVRDQDDFDETKQGLTGGRRKRRGGELYDAFAGESDEDIYSDEEDSSGRYEDTPSGSSGDGPDHEKR